MESGCPVVEFGFVRLLFAQGAALLLINILFTFLVVLAVGAFRAVAEATLTLGAIGYHKSTWT